MCGLIESNLDLCEVPEDQTEVLCSEAAEFLKHASSRKQQPWDIVFFDPPTATDYLQLLEVFSTRRTELLTKAGLLIVEHHHKNALPETLAGITRTRILKQGDSSLSFYS